MDDLRLFTAIQPPSPVLRAIADIQTHMKGRIGTDAVRWVARSNLHVTLQFLGDTAADAMQTVREAMSAGIASASVSGTVPLTLAGAGAFPSAARARVIWIGVTDQTGDLGRIERAVRLELSRGGIRVDEKPFRPHITVGYVRRHASRESMGAIAIAVRECPHEPVTFEVSECTLQQRTLAPGGSVYSTLYSVSLSPARSETSSGASARE